MPAETKTAKRPYLAREQRRQHLLDTAAQIVEEQGWDRLSMSALAQQASTSRQLVYQHFDSLEDLMLATGTHIFEQVYLQTRETIAAGDKDIMSVLAEAQRLTLDLPPGRARALWQIIAAAFPSGHELNRFGRRIRHLITNLWRPALAREFDLEDDVAGDIAWMLVMAFWGGHRLVEDGELSKDQAMERLNWMLSGMLQGHQGKSR